MNPVTQLIKILTENPKSYIYYYDTGCFYIYTSKVDFEREYDGDGNFEKYELFHGSDKDSEHNHLPLLVEAFSQILGFSAESV